MPRRLLTRVTANHPPRGLSRCVVPREAQAVGMLDHVLHQAAAMVPPKHQQGSNGDDGGHGRHPPHTGGGHTAARPGAEAEPEPSRHRRRRRHRHRSHGRSGSRSHSRQRHSGSRDASKEHRHRRGRRHGHRRRRSHSRRRRVDKSVERLLDGVPPPPAQDAAATEFSGSLQEIAAGALDSGDWSDGGGSADGAAVGASPDAERTSRGAGAGSVAARVNPSTARGVTGAQPAVVLGAVPEQSPTTASPDDASPTHSDDHSVNSAAAEADQPAAPASAASSHATRRADAANGTYGASNTAPPPPPPPAWGMPVKTAAGHPSRAKPGVHKKALSKFARMGAATLPTKVAQERARTAERKMRAQEALPESHAPPPSRSKPRTFITLPHARTRMHVHATPRPRPRPRPRPCSRCLSMLSTRAEPVPSSTATGKASPPPPPPPPPVAPPPPPPPPSSSSRQGGRHRAQRNAGGRRSAGGTLQRERQMPKSELAHQNAPFSLAVPDDVRLPAMRPKQPRLVVAKPNRNTAQGRAARLARRSGPAAGQPAPSSPGVSAGITHDTYQLHPYATSPPQTASGGGGKGVGKQAAGAQRGPGMLMRQDSSLELYRRRQREALREQHNKEQRDKEAQRHAKPLWVTTARG